MPSSCRSIATLLGSAVLLLVGCTDTYRITFVMTPDSVARVEVTGDAPLTMVTNDGPGPIEATFDADHDREETMLVAAGTASGRTLQGSKTVRLESASTGATVRVEAHGATGLRLHGATPKATSVE